MNRHLTKNFDSWPISPRKRPAVSSSVHVTHTCNNHFLHLQRPMFFILRLELIGRGSPDRQKKKKEEKNSSQSIQANIWFSEVKMAASEAGLRVRKILSGHPYHLFFHLSKARFWDPEIQGINVRCDNRQDVPLDLKLQSTGLLNHDALAEHFIYILGMK